MKKILILLLASSLLFSCSSSRKNIKSSGTTTQTTTTTGDAVSGDGSSIEKAIVIQEKTETKGVDAEYEWLRKNYPGYTMINQRLVFKDEKHYDILKIKTSDGETKEICFDISKFFGKF